MVSEPICRHCVAVVQADKAMLQPTCGHCDAGVQAVKAVTESSCRHLPGTEFLRFRLFKLCGNLPAMHCVAVVQAV